MERLVNICLVLALIFVRFSLQYAFKVSIKPNASIFTFDVGKKPTENISCDSNCSQADCKYKWFVYKQKKNIEIEEGSILSSNRVEKGRNIYRCYVEVTPDRHKSYGYSNDITIIMKEEEPDASSTQSFLSLHSSTTTVFSQSALAGLSDGSFLFIVIGISGAVFLIITAIVVGILCFRANKKRKTAIRNDTTQKKDPPLELTENVLYITAVDVPEVPPSAPPDQDTTASDVYAVVNKENKNGNHIPAYAEVRTSKKGKDNQKTETKPDEKEGNNPGQSANKDGMVYIEIDFNDKTSNGNTVLHGAEDKILYVDIDSVKHSDPPPKIEGEGNHDSQKNGKE